MVEPLRPASDPRKPELSTLRQRLRVLSLSLAGAALSFFFSVIYVYRIGVGSSSDSFFAALILAQGALAILLSPFTNFGLHFALVEIDQDREPLWGLLAACTLLASAVLVPYYLLGAAILGPLFGSAYAISPERWSYHFYWAGLLIPTTGLALLAELCAQAKRHDELAKAASVLGRGAAVVLVAAAPSPDAVAVPALVMVNLVVAAVCIYGAHSSRITLVECSQQVSRALRQWFQVSRWGGFLKTDTFLDRFLSAHLEVGFLTAFSLAWGVVAAVTSFYQTTFITPDTREYFYRRRNAPETEPVGVMLRRFPRSRQAAPWLVLACATLFAAVWSLGTVGVPLDVHTNVKASDAALLLVTIVFVLAALMVQRQLAGLYSLDNRVPDFTRILALLYLAAILPRLGATVIGGATGFLLGFAAYYSAQLWALTHGLRRRPGKDKDRMRSDVP